jgi:hypothetical protein
MLTKEDTSADEFGITDADVAEWDAEVARYKTHPDEFYSWEQVEAEIEQDLRQDRNQRTQTLNGV